MTDRPLDEMKAAAIKLRSLADMQERLIGLEQFLDVSAHHGEFARFSIGVARAAAAALDGAIAVHLATHAELGDPQPAPRPRLSVIDGDQPPAA